MTSTGLDAFDRTVHTSNVWLKDLQTTLGWDDRHHVYSAFVAVIRALRDRLPPGEATQLVAQLPMLLAGAYVQGWRPETTPQRLDRAGFLDRVEETLKASVPGADAEWVTREVFDLLGRRVSPGELNDVVSNLPPELQELWATPWVTVGQPSEEERRPGADGLLPQGQLQEWNVVVTTHQRGYDGAVETLTDFGTVGRTTFGNVLVVRADDVRAFLESLREAGERDPELFTRVISHVVPADQRFVFHTPEEFHASASDYVRNLAPQLDGRSFHVRVHRHGYAGRISSAEEERYLGEEILREIESRGGSATVTFDDPDAVVTVETVSTGAGVCLLTRKQLRRYPFLGVERVAGASA